jgi:uncharacterized caspase-like protein
MHQLSKILFLFLASLSVVSLPQAGAAAPEKRLALVIGNASYKVKSLATPVNDAALIAQTLQAAGFDVMGARDLEGDLLGQAFRDFADRVRSAGPDAVAAVYFAGYGQQFEGENYLVPAGSDIGEASEVPVRALPLSEQIHVLAALHLKATFIILDMARAVPLDHLPSLAGGLAWVEPEANMLIAFNAAPGTVAPQAGETYGPYAKALAEMIGEGNLTPAILFDRVRLRVNEATNGAQVPWHTSKIETKFKFFERTSGTSQRTDSPEHTASIRSQPMRGLGVHDAYMVALMRDTFDAYADFVADYWDDSMAKRVRALLAARREAMTWRQTYQTNVPEAYWSYLERYPGGPHVGDARRLLTHLDATIEPTSKFARIEYDVPPPLPDELEYVERNVLVFNDPAFGFEQLQPSPVYFLEPPPPKFLDLTPPTAPSVAYLLPTLGVAPLPDDVHIPADVAPQLNTSIKSINETKRDVQANSSLYTIDTNNFADGVRLPPSVAARAQLIDSKNLPPPAISSVAPVDIKAPSAPPSLTASSTPIASANKNTPTRPVIEPPTATTDIESPNPVLTLEPPSTGVLTGAWSSALGPATESGPQPLPRSVAVGRLQSGPSPGTPDSSLPSPETTGSIPAATLPPKTLEPQSNEVPLGTWSTDMLLRRAAARGLLPIVGSAALAPSRTSFLPRTPGRKVPSPDGTGRISASMSRSVAFAPTLNHVLVDAGSRDKLLRGPDGRRPVVRSVAHERLRNRESQRMNGSSVPSPATIDHVSASTSRLVTSAPSSTGQRSRPITDAASTPPQ